jgi:alkanesulfonate monooxygenase SsuD/methylene tetrahydromethanopterin reductase-like flavin-dependent oxidoreductase (luciferase family)
MKASYLCSNTYLSTEAFGHAGWPTPQTLFDPAVGQRSVAIALDQARQADEMGFDWVSVSEHHYSPFIQAPNACVLAAALGQVVRRAKIAVLGPLVAMNNPVRIAEELAMLDQLTGGRLLVLFLRGTPNEILSYGVNPDETRARTQEASILITRALTEKQPFGWVGRYYRFRTVSVWPGPVQQPHPPFYYSGNSPESAGFAAAQRMGLGISFYPVDLAAKLAAHYRQECAKHGWAPTSDQLLYRCRVAVGEDEAEAAALKVKLLGGRPPDALYRGRGAMVEPAQASRPGLGLNEVRFCGDPDSVVRQITDFHAATGLGVIDGIFGGAALSLEQTAKSMRLFTTEVLPRIRPLGQTAPRLQAASAAQ